MNCNSEPQFARAIAEVVATHGGVCYYVGGYVRDALLGLKNKDTDVVLTAELCKFLKKLA